MWLVNYVTPCFIYLTCHFEKGLVPDKLKLAKVVLVFKGGNELLPNNYRPISLLNVFDKLLEKLMAVRLYGF